MTAPTAAWLGWQVGMSGPTVLIIKNTLWDKYSWVRTWPGFTVNDVYDATTEQVVISFQGRVGLPATGIANFATQSRLGSIGASPPQHILLTGQGTGQPDPMGPGYPADMARAVDPASNWRWQPCGNYPATAFPMAPSIQDLVNEMVRQLTEVWPWQTWGAIHYSQAAIALAILIARCQPGGDLQDSGILERFIGGYTFGNPSREAGVTIPGGIDPGGSGIVLPNMVNTPKTLWNAACGKAMVNSPGNDLYTTCGAGETATGVTDQRLVWNIVDTGSVGSVLALPLTVLKLLLSQPNWTGDLGAVEAALGALDFFVVKAITPHTSYGIIQPIPGDPRDAWRIGLDHINDIGANTAPAIKPV